MISDVRACLAGLANARSSLFDNPSNLVLHLYLLRMNTQSQLTLWQIVSLSVLFPLVYDDDR